MAAIVLDASVLLTWLLEGADRPGLLPVIDLVAEHGALAPLIFRLEVANGLRNAERAKMITAREVDMLLEDVSVLPIEFDDEVERGETPTVMSLARRTNLKIYDTVYLELARRRTLPLSTIDRDLTLAALKIGVDVVP